MRHRIYCTRAPHTHTHTQTQRVQEARHTHTHGAVSQCTTGKREVERVGLEQLEKENEESDTVGHKSRKRQKKGGERRFSEAQGRTYTGREGESTRR